MMFLVGITSMCKRVVPGAEGRSGRDDEARLALQQIDREIRSGNVFYDPALEDDPADDVRSLDEPPRVHTKPTATTRTPTSRLRPVADQQQAPTDEGVGAERLRPRRCRRGARLPPGSSTGRRAQPCPPSSRRRLPARSCGWCSSSPDRTTAPTRSRSSARSPAGTRRATTPAMSATSRHEPGAGGWVTRGGLCHGHRAPRGGGGRPRSASRPCSWRFTATTQHARPGPHPGGARRRGGLDATNGRIARAAGDALPCSGTGTTTASPPASWAVVVSYFATYPVTGGPTLMSDRGPVAPLVRLRRARRSDRWAP